jgi:hypothetical protein
MTSDFSTYRFSPAGIADLARTIDQLDCSRIPVFECSKGVRDLMLTSEIAAFAAICAMRGEETFYVKRDFGPKRLLMQQLQCVTRASIVAHIVINFNRFAEPTDESVSLALQLLDAAGWPVLPDRWRRLH